MPAEIVDTPRTKANLKAEKQQQKDQKKAEKKGKKHLKVGNRKLLISRLIGVSIIFAMIAGLIWLFMASPLSDPIQEAAAPIWEPMVAIINDPLGVDWGGWIYTIGFMAISYIGFISLLSDRRI